MRKHVYVISEKKKESDQQVHLRGLISVFVRCQEDKNNIQS